MCIIHGLALFFIILEGIIIQCEGSPNDNSPNEISESSDDDNNEDLSSNELIPIMPQRFIDVITSYMEEMEQINLKNIVGELIEDEIVAISPHTVRGTAIEYYAHGCLYLELGSHQHYVKFFEKFGDKVKKVEIKYSDRIGMPRDEYNQTIIKNCANTLEELRILTNDDELVWLDFSNNTFFPEVKKFQFIRIANRNEFKLNFIFPKLKSVKLGGMVKDLDWLASLKPLIELELDTTSISEHQLIPIFAIHKSIRSLTLLSPRKWVTMQSIANLTELESLCVTDPGGNFLFRTYEGESYKLSSLLSFIINFRSMDALIGVLSFEMPQLKRLRMRALLADNRIVHFIENFDTVESLELIMRGFDILQYIENLPNIEEITIINFEDHQLLSLRRFFEDEISKLQVLKLLNLNGFEYQDYENTMIKINSRLEYAGKSTWILSYEEESGEGYLLFRRQMPAYASRKKLRIM